MAGNADDGTPFFGSHKEELLENHEEEEDHEDPIQALEGVEEEVAAAVHTPNSQEEVASAVASYYAVVGVLHIRYCMGGSSFRDGGLHGEKENHRESIQTEHEVEAHLAAAILSGCFRTTWCGRI